MYFCTLQIPDRHGYSSHVFEFWGLLTWTDAGSNLGQAKVYGATDETCQFIFWVDDIAFSRKKKVADRYWHETTCEQYYYSNKV